MNKNLADLIKELEGKLEGINAEDIERVINEFVELVKTSMVSGEVMIRNFGKFFTAERAAKKARNPHTGEEINVPARIAPRFKFSKAFSQEVKDGKISSSDPHDETLEREWFVAIADKAKGPFNNERVAKMLKSKKITSQTLVYSPQIGGDWKPLAETELKPATQEVPPIPTIPAIPPVPTAA